VTLRPWRLPLRYPLTPPGSRPSTTFDHPYFATADIERPRAKLPETNLGFALAPTRVTMSTLRDIVSAALGYRVAPTNRARVIERRDLIEPTGARRPVRPAGALLWCITSSAGNSRSLIRTRSSGHPRRLPEVGGAQRCRTSGEVQ
jgi:hypothetical protein